MNNTFMFFRMPSITTNSFDAFLSTLNAVLNYYMPTLFKNLGLVGDDDDNSYAEKQLGTLSTDSFANGIDLYS